MVKKEVVLRTLRRYENDLAKGIIPPYIESVLKLHDAYKGVLQTSGQIEELASGALSQHTPRAPRLALRMNSRQTRFKSRMAEIEGEPEYLIGIFAKENLSLKSDDIPLTQKRAEENQDRLYEYRKQLESQVV